MEIRDLRHIEDFWSLFVALDITLGYGDILCTYYFIILLLFILNCGICMYSFSHLYGNTGDGKQMIFLVRK